MYVEGDAGARAGIAMKGGTLIVGGDAGYMSGFMMQTGTHHRVRRRRRRARRLDVRGPHLRRRDGRRRWGRTPWCGAHRRGPRRRCATPCAPYGIDAAATDFTKIESGRRLWNFDTKEAELWKDAL